MLENGKERINTCFKALKILDFRAFDIIFAELIRLELDERKSDEKSVRIKVDTDAQKRITETLCVLVNKYRKEKDVYSEMKSIDVFVGDKEASENEGFQIIDFTNFNYEQEKDKLMNRFNSTILGHADIIETLLKQGLTPNNIELQRLYGTQVKELKNQIDKLTGEIVKDEHSILSIFKRGKISKKEAERENLEWNKRALLQEYNEKTDKNAQEAEKRKCVVKRLMEKEERLLGIKFVFTQRREKVKRYYDINGQVHYYIENEENLGNNPNRKNNDFLVEFE